MGLNESPDFISQFAHAGEHPPPEGAPLQLAEPGFDGVEPGRAGRGEMQVKAGMGGQKVPNRFGRMRAGVVDDQVQGQRRRRGAVDLREELAELGSAMAPGDAAEHLAGRNVEGGIFAVPCRL